MLMTLAEAATHLGTTPEALGHFVENGVAPCLDLTCGPRFRREEMDHWVLGRGLYRDPTPLGATLQTRLDGWPPGESWRGWAVAPELRADTGELPAWARQGAFSFTRFDGGPIERDKGRLTGWKIGQADFDALVSAYEDGLDTMVARLCLARVNWVWITWSNGFSLRHESRQFERCRAVIARLHQAGISVTAYLSCNNMFWEEMAQGEPDSRAWPLVEGGVNLCYENLPARRLANLRDPGWLEYTKERMRPAVEAGVDGFFFDNCEAPTEDLMFFFPRVRRWLREELKSSALLTLNIHVYHRPCNIPLEDLCDVIYNEFIFAVPGVDESGAWNVSNVRNPYRYVSGHLPAGKPVFCELPRSMHDILPPRVQKLFTYEAAAFGASADRCLEGYTLTGLANSAPDVMASWTAVGEANGFLDDHRGLYTDTQSAAVIGLLAYGPTWEPEFADALTRLSLPYDILEIRALDRIELSRYRLLVLAGAPAPDRRMLEGFPRFRAAGGRVAVLTDHPRAFADLADVIWPAARLAEAAADSAGARRLAEELLRMAGPPRVEVSGGHVLANLRKKTDGSSWLLHLLNYDADPAKEVGVVLSLGAETCVSGEPALFSPDRTEARIEGIAVKGSVVRFAVRALDQYAVVTVPTA